MSKVKVSVTLEREVLQQVRELAGDRGVSRFLNEAAKARLQKARVVGYLDDLDRLHGAPDEEARREANRKLGQALLP